ncbi:DUF1534 domain-containing protein, partial [Pseudomonas syringae pv. actinidiae]|nr:DUF1534 domain-containing protein [Pseudomonas syringae pv. actinidiae]
QRRNALGDAPRHRLAPRRAFKTGRRASHDSRGYRSPHHSVKMPCPRLTT